MYKRQALDWRYGDSGIYACNYAPWGRAHDVSDEGGGTRTSGFQAGAKGKIDSKNPVYDLYCCLLYTSFTVPTAST